MLIFFSFAKFFISKFRPNSNLNLEWFCLLGKPLPLGDARFRTMGPMKNLRLGICRTWTVDACRYFQSCHMMGLEDKIFAKKQELAPGAGLKIPTFVFGHEMSWPMQNLTEKLFGLVFEPRHLNLGRYLVKVTFWPNFLQAKRKSFLESFDHLAKKNIWFTFEHQNESNIMPINDVLRFYIKVGNRTTNETFDVSCCIIFGFVVPFHNYHVRMNLPIEASESRIISSSIITRHVSGFHFFLLLLFLSWIFFHSAISTLVYR